jgi:hypothetical protein
MRQTFHYFSIVFFALFLIACSGGNELSSTSNGDGGNGTTPTTPQSTVVLTMVDTSGNTVTNVDGSQPQWLSALYTVDNNPVANKKFTFSLDGDIGQLLVTSALTDAQGIAKVEIYAGDTVGAGTATATVDDLTDSLDFSTSNPVEEIQPVNLVLKMVDSDGKEILNVSSLEPTRLQATLTNSGVAAVGVKIDFSLVDEVGELKTSSALTDSNGIASVLLYAGAQDGAGTVNASVNGVNASLDFSAAVTVANVVMGELRLTPTVIGPNGTASLEVPINEVVGGNASPLSQPVGVQFSSACVQAGKAEIASEVQTINGVATVTYKDNGCGSVDTINVTSTIGQTVLTENINLTVGKAELHSLQFTNITSSFLALKGTGGLNRSETTTVTFTVFDSLSNPVPNAFVNFKLTTKLGGITILPEEQAETDDKGEVNVIVAAGTVPTPVRVVATLEDDKAISTVSGQLSISSGVVDYNSFSLSATELNPDTFRTDGVEVGITARLADHFNNPVPDGTTVSFTTESGFIEGNCNTVNGACSVQWRSQGSRLPSPAFTDDNAKLKMIGEAQCLNSNGVVTGLSAAGLPCFYDNNSENNDNGGLGNVYGNRVTILAYAIGEESFSDSDGSGYYTQNEAFTDLTEAFRDENEDGVFGGRFTVDAVSPGAADVGAKCYKKNIKDTSEKVCFEPGGDNEQPIDFNSNDTFDQGNKLYNGVLCHVDDEATGICSRELVHVYQNVTILQASGAAADFRFGFIEVTATHETDKFNPANYDKTVDISGGDKTIIVYAADQFNGLLPNGTIINFETGNGSIVGPSECEVGNSSGFAINSCSVTLKKDDESDSSSLTVTITAPNRTGVSRSIPIRD